MDKNTDIGIIPEKEKEPLKGVMFVTVYFRVLFGPVVIFPFYFWYRFGILYAPLGIVAAAVISIPLAFMTLYLVEKSTTFFKLIYGTGRADYSLREQMEIKLKTVRVAKMDKEYKKALVTVNEILRRDPGFNEALLVKAQILNEGFQNPENAKRYLRKVMNNAQQGQPVHTWATALYEELSPGNPDR